MVVSDRELDGLSPADRADLLAALLRASDDVVTPVDRRRRGRFLLFVAVALVVLVGWIAELGATLPQTETIGQWRVAWVGFDVGLVLAFAACGWSAWQARQLLVPALLVTGTLLLCDAWFDVALSWNTDERWWSVVSAAVLEVPIAAGFWLLARRLTLRTISVARARLGLTGAVPAWHAMRLFDPLIATASRERP